MSESTSPRSQLEHLLDHVAHLLPIQGPIGVFVHHNTLHSFQHLPFEQAVVDASRIFDTEPYMPEKRYREEFAANRIRVEDIDAVLALEPDGVVLPGLTLRSLRRSLLIEGVREFDAVGIEWRLDEGDLAREFENPEARSLFQACVMRTPQPPATPARSADPVDDVIHPWLIRLCSVYLDQGMSYWPMPSRQDGFYKAVRRLFSTSGALLPQALSGLAAAFRRQAAANEEAVDVVMRHLGPDSSTWEARLRRELLALPGWAGLMRRLETEPELAPHQDLPCSLMDFLAVRLTFAGIAATQSPKLPAVPRPDPEAARLARAAAIYEAARKCDIGAAHVSKWTSAEWDAFVDAVESCNALERRRLYHLAYEHWHQQEILLGIAAHRRAFPPQPRAGRPKAQVFFCIDEREESTRRALEEVDPEIETLSAAGFFGVAVDYKGIDDAHGVPLCPVVVKPQHAVRERPAPGQEPIHRARMERRHLWARVAQGWFISSRSLVRGAVATAVLGLLSTIPLIARVLAPRRYALLRERLNKAFFPEPRTELTLMRDDARSHEAVEGLLNGFAIAEKADRVAGVLAAAGLASGHSRIVIVLGHGSTSLNNPHESAHDCGACGGRRGGPNARLFATMANNPLVRELLPQRGVTIPADTWFVGGYHDTCSDDVQYFDVDLVPDSHHADLRAAQASIDAARELGAHERARRFEACSHDATPAAALWHVEERSEHLGEPRPEYGHCTNSVCVVGRRATTRGLYFDRRAFLVSYDATTDPEGLFLGRILGAVVPVCGGISLEYYFSFVDNERYGCGTKLPHNVTGLVGVMNGQSSDLRTGLPLQMVEIHEPVRILFVIEARPERLDEIMKANKEVAEFVRNRWIRVAMLDPDSGEITIWRNNVYEPLQGEVKPLPVVARSSDWYRGKIEHLTMAEVHKGAVA